jgi:hypothetical protein
MDSSTGALDCVNGGAAGICSRPSVATSPAIHFFLVTAIAKARDKSKEYSGFQNYACLFFSSSHFTS